MVKECHRDSGLLTTPTSILGADDSPELVKFLSRYWL